ncbi:MAG: hypothetical protein SOZ18_07985, partial [Phocaeicola sp.]|nr:hypothetical protein [Phocaeicola sp.]
MKNFYKLGAYAFAMLLGLSACSKDTPEEQEKTPQNPTEGKTIYLSLNGAFNAEEDSRAQLRPTDLEKIKVEFTDQELFSGPDNARVKGPKTGKLTFYIVNDTDLGNVTKAEVDPTDFRKNPDGTYSISYAGPITLNAGADFNTGNWYICGGYCVNKHSYFHGAIYLNQNGLLERAGTIGSDPLLPFIFGWTKLDTWSNNPSLKKDSGVKKGIKFLPDAFFSRVRVINNFVEDVQLLSFHLYTNNNFTFGEGNGIMYYDPQPTREQLNTGALLRATTRKYRTNGKEDIVYTYQISAYQANGSFVKDLGATANNPKDPTKGWSARTLAAGEAFTEYFRQIGPTNSPDSCMKPGVNNGIIKYAAYYDNWALGTTAGGTALDNRDREGMPSGLKTVNWWRGASYLDGAGINSFITYAAQSYRDRYLENGKFRRGRVNNINYKTSSDLMITELYTTLSSNGKSYGLIEIYNPTLDPIDLSNYALMRIHHTAAGKTQYVRVVPKNTPTSFDYETALSGASPIEDIDEALLQPLDFRTGPATGLWAINSLNQPYKHVPVEDKINRVRFNPGKTPKNITYTGYNTRMRDYSTGILNNLNAVQPGKTILSPGKTILILFSGFVDSSYKPTTAEDKALFEKIQKAINAGYCEYVVALDNSKVENSAPSDVNAGVMTADLGDSFSLVKTTKIHKEYDFVKAKGIKEQMRLVVDGTWTSYPYDPKGVINKLLNNTSVKALLRRPYGPYIWNVGFLDTDASERYYQKEFKLENATFGVPYHTSYDKHWSQ